MTTTDINTAISEWSSWAASTHRYDIALFKIWIQFEKFISQLFVDYCIGNTSESGYSPTLNLQFKDETQLNAFLVQGNKKYIEYPDRIQRLSKHIFETNPFDIIFADSTNKTAYDQIVAIRNYVAHESGEAKIKLIKTCFSGNSNNFKEPNDYLQSKERSSRTSYFTYYTTIINNMSLLLVNPPE